MPLTQFMQTVSFFKGYYFEHTPKNERHIQALNICHYLKNKVRTPEKFHPSAYKVIIHLFFIKINIKIERIHQYAKLNYCAK